MTSGKGMIIMARNVAIGIQNFEEIIKGNCFYIDKTNFIKEWWDSKDSVTLITRPRRFGKTLNMSMIEEFFSMDYAGRGDLFEGLSIWEEEKYQKLQGTYPVISLSFARIKETNYQMTRKKICQHLTELYAKNSFIYPRIFSGSCFRYSLKVIRLASEAMSVPVPPIFTATSNS